ncbi:hypothetical protein QCB44_01545 [Thiomicrorhabdus sp. zzn3]|uniref:hypothetical protein n=1 Tax=Thiomicrorhabdus sp. zzn3 TaxID=3039775 RepID=UPI002436E863|nr:hypothetical protein [Thiomicrorhabdus sp. zzn3]MDG6777382.1 hypothetical protein [Thiomicrorhabdus sp. zzn3]
MFLIPSAAYIDPEFQAELGMLPPSLLPIANQRLITLQVGSIRKFSDEPIYLSLPKGFLLDEKDKNLLLKLRVQIIWVDASLSLGESINQALTQIVEDGKVSILYGDTLLKELPDKTNCVAIAETHENYSWYVDSECEGKQFVWAGYFSFDCKNDLLEQLKIQGFDFLGFVQKSLDEKKLVREKVSSWFDAGHINTYFNTRSCLTSERCFNSISINKNVVTKKGLHDDKIAAEAYWFQTVPSGIKRLTPNLIESGIDADGRSFYSIEYLYYMPLNELAVHGRLPIEAWVGIFDACLEYFEEAKQTQVPSELLGYLSIERETLFKQKSYLRVKAFEKNSRIRFDQPVLFNDQPLPAINQIVDELIGLALKIPAQFSVIHGDFCFSNIIYDSRSRSVKLIDPRGIMSNGSQSIYGDLVYDYAKFMHSLVGYYDFIIAGSYELNIEGQNIKFKINVRDDMDSLLSLILHKEIVEGISAESVLPLTILLFFSMLPLHSDSEERQYALLANALRLYCEYKGIK